MTRKTAAKRRLITSSIRTTSPRAANSISCNFSTIDGTRWEVVSSRPDGDFVYNITVDSDLNITETHKDRNNG